MEKNNFEKLNFKNGCSILIPSWNNINYLSNCIKFILKNSSFDHEILVHLNEFTIQEIESVKNISEKIKITTSSENIGVCKALNLLSKISTKNILGYFNDDMVALPSWDLNLQKFSDERQCDESWVLASTMIEPYGNNECCIAPYNFGDSLENFNYKDLLNFIDQLGNKRHNVMGSTWPPNFIHRNLWNKINGYSEEYNVGFGSDPDIIAKCYSLGCRNFIGVGNSLVYHFQSKTTKKVPKAGIGVDDMFKNKFNIDMMAFVHNILRRGSIYK